MAIVPTIGRLEGIMLIWLEYDSIAFAVMALGIAAVELLAWSI